MATRNVVLTTHQSGLVERLVASGRYQNASEVLRDGLRLVEGREAEDKARLKSLREAAQAGVADFEAGRYVSFDAPGEMRAYLTARMKKVIAAAVAPARSK